MLRYAGGLMAAGAHKHSGGDSAGYCVIPRKLAPKLHDLLRGHFGAEGRFEVVVESRSVARRSGQERRRADRSVSEERRRIRGLSGRRIDDRRAATVLVDLPSLPRRARSYADQLTFLERLGPSAQHLEDADTARLVNRIQAGEQDAFVILYQRYFDRVYSYLRLLLRSPHEAEDAAQQVFLNVLGGLKAYERRDQPFRAWLFIVVRNLARNYLAKTGRVDLIDPAELDRRLDTHDHASDPAALVWLSDKELTFLIERLPLPQRQVLMLRYMLDFSPAEIAAVLGRSANDVRVLQHRALQFLKQRLTALDKNWELGTQRPMISRVREAKVLRARRFALVR
jgi:RNA polymerase sigma factor (sigma-70 family)